MITTRIEEERRFWDEAAGRPELTVLHLPEPFDFQAVTNRHVSRILGLVDGLTAGSSVLDLGCGPGRLANRVALCAPNVWIHGLDISEAMLELARAERAAAGLRSDQVAYSLCDGRQIPGAAQYAAAWSVLLFQHLPLEAVERYLHELAAHLRPDAPFLFQFVEADQDEEAGPFSFGHSPATMHRLVFKAGFVFEAEGGDEDEDRWLWWTVRRR